MMASPGSRMEMGGGQATVAARTALEIMDLAFGLAVMLDAAQRSSEGVMVSVTDPRG